LGHAAELTPGLAVRASILAGGTDLLVEMKDQRKTPEYLVDLKQIEGLDYLTYDDTCGLRIGALATVQSVGTSPAVAQHYAGLAEAAGSLGSVQVRNRATVAGNICRASPSADTLPPLIAGDATVTIFGPAGTRIAGLADFFTGPGWTVLSPGEILVEISVPAPLPNTGTVYLKHGRRAAMELATVGVAVALTLAGPVCARARIVLGAVAPTPIRARLAEAALQGRTVDETAIEEADQAAMHEARPISDVRSSAGYRQEMVEVLTRRAIRAALARATQGA
jgi:carbon-monoxide dehydrogenase medium subunit